MGGAACRTCLCKDNETTDVQSNHGTPSKINNSHLVPCTTINQINNTTNITTNQIIDSTSEANNSFICEKKLNETNYNKSISIASLDNKPEVITYKDDLKNYTFSSDNSQLAKVENAYLLSNMMHKDNNRKLSATDVIFNNIKYY